MIRLPVTDAERQEELEERAAFFRGAADRINAVASELQAEGMAFGGARGRKVFLSDVAERMGMSMKRLAPLVADFHTMGWVELARADLVGAMDRATVEASTIIVGNEHSKAEYQFIRAPDAPRRNPARGGGGDDLERLDPEEVERAAEMYEKFHRLPVNRVAVVLEMEMPTRAAKVGRATHVLYRSGKVDPETGKKPRAPQNYIHDHDAGVDLYEPGTGDVEVPRAIAQAQGLVLLGKCLGLGYIDPDDGERYEMEGGNPLPELYCTPDGKALVIVEAKREILFIVWGGALGVEPRGIVG